MKTEFSNMAAGSAMRWTDEPLNALLLTLAGTGLVVTLTIASALLSL